MLSEKAEEGLYPHLSAAVCNGCAALALIVIVFLPRPVAMCAAANTTVMNATAPNNSLPPARAVVVVVCCESILGAGVIPG